MSETFSGVTMTGPEAHRWYSPDAIDRFKHYVSSIVVPSKLERILAEDFLHIDGSLRINEHAAPAVGHVMATPGRDSFIWIFRNMVNGQIQPAGNIRGEWVSPLAYQPLQDTIEAQLGGAVIRGGLIAVGAVRFPYVLRPGGNPLDLPPPFQSYVREGEQPFEPLSATGDPQLDRADVDVIQAVYGTDDTITGRVGLVWGRNPRAVPFTLHEQITARRAGQTPDTFTPTQVAQAINSYSRM